MSEGEKQPEIPAEEFYKVEVGKPYPVRPRWGGEYDLWEEGCRQVEAERKDRAKRIRHQIRDELANAPDQETFDALIEAHTKRTEELTETEEWTRATLQINSYEVTSPDGKEYNLAVCFEPWYKKDLVYGEDPQYMVLINQSIDST